MPTGLFQKSTKIEVKRFLKIGGGGSAKKDKKNGNMTDINKTVKIRMLIEELTVLAGLKKLKEGQDEKAEAKGAK